MQISTHRIFVAIVPYSSAMSIIRWWLSLDMLAIIETCPNSQHQQQQQQNWTRNTDTQQINIYLQRRCMQHALHLLIWRTLLLCFVPFHSLADYGLTAGALHKTIYLNKFFEISFSCVVWCIHSHYLFGTGMPINQYKRHFSAPFNAVIVHLRHKWSFCGKAPTDVMIYIWVWMVNTWTMLVILHNSFLLLGSRRCAKFLSQTGLLFRVSIRWKIFKCDLMCKPESIICKWVGNLLNMLTTGSLENTHFTLLPCFFAYLFLRPPLPLSSFPLWIALMAK